MKIDIDNVYNCDCLELMQSMIEQNIIADWCITDPPYGIGFKKICGGVGLYQNRTYVYKSWDENRISKAYFDLIFKCSKNQIIFGGNYYTDILPLTNNWIVWDKRVDDKYRNDFGDCEFAWCSQGQSRVFRYLYNGMIQGNMKCKNDRFHPTQKPTQIIEQLINYYTKKGDLIFDGFMGSFTTAVACHRLQRHYIGAELDKDYFKLGSERLENEKNQLSIFDL